MSFARQQHNDESPQKEQITEGLNTPPNTSGGFGDQSAGVTGGIVYQSGSPSVDSPGVHTDHRWDEDTDMAGSAPSGARDDGGEQNLDKASLGQRLKGTTEKVAGRATCDARLTTRGEARKVGGL
ncbi:hypothetical protein CERSUDRAFT_94562 [Gelatoporia subvermispora B]|uniref:CsbD-like domain-containing protein n=1 Tax=Ceriporiopsis subvermispora (strain B) TaxID=914234 RepID=M2RFH3_CERS8|nr:hypothetical protein CERSUDRAFT_94562 [Gelatoporia subvermispora B]